MGAGPVGVGDAGLDGLRATRDPRRGVHHQRLAADIPSAPRSQEEAYLHAAITADCRHLVQRGVGEHHDAGALRDPVDPDALLIGLLEHRAQDGRPLDARDLEVVSAAVAEASRRLGREPRRRVQADARQHGRVAAAQPFGWIGAAHHRASLMWFT